MSQPSATTHGHEAFDPRSPKTLLITACFAYPSEQGSFSGIHYYPWLSINVQQRKDASYPGLEELEAWCVASTGQLGRFAPFEPTAPSHDVEVLKWQFEDNTRFVDLLFTVVPSSELARNGPGQSSSSSSATSSRTSASAASSGREVSFQLADGPQHLFLHMPGVESWSLDTRAYDKTKRSSLQKALRSAVVVRDQHCRFTLALKGISQAAHLVKATNSPWAIVHILCSRLRLSSSAPDDLQTIRGPFHPSNAVLLNASMRLCYDNNDIAFNVESSTAEEVSLRCAPLSAEGQHAIGPFRPNLMNAIKWHDYDTSDKDTTATPSLRKKRKTAPSHIAKPLDIFAQFALGARVLSKFGSREAGQLASMSPLTQEYWLQRRGQDSALPLELEKAIEASQEWYGHFISARKEEEARDRIAHWVLDVAGAVE